MTSFCNFDMSDNFDSFTNKTESDCYEYCTIDLGCSASNLGNGVCDEACSWAECGFDWGDCGYCSKNCFLNSLEDDNCDQICNVSSCFWDLNACEQCSPDCTKELFQNEECDQECYTPSCNYDNQMCPMDENICAEGCFDHMKKNGVCDSECNNADCNFDEEDCLCASGCFKTASDGECDPDCQGKECNFDFGDCEYCSDQCSASDLGDGECKSECYNLDCNWDGGDCCSEECSIKDLGDGECKNQCNNSECNWDGGDCKCSEECNLQYLGQCKPECLNPFCYYDEYPGMPQCGDSVLKHLAIYTQILFKNLTRSVKLEDCLDKGCKNEDIEAALEPCSENCCVDSCNNNSCGLYWSKCGEEDCEEACEVCGNGESCLKCKSHMYQYLGRCYSECPVGTQPQSFDFFGFDKFCVPYTEPSSAESPKQYFVDSRTNSLNSTGTADNPFASISIALSSIFTDYSEIILVDEGPFKLTKTPQDYVFQSSLENESDPLSKTGFHPKSISIIKTGNPAILSVSSPSEFMYFETSRELKMKNVIIEGSNIFPECTGDIYCDYCPIKSEIGGKIVSDKGVVLEENEYFDDCSSYHYKDLFVVQKEGNLYLEDVKFENLRMELYSLIHSKGGSVHLKNVEFKNIRNMSLQTSSVIVFEECSQYYNCGDFNFIGGNVSLLNNGYELPENIDFTGFFYAFNIRNILIEGVNFSYNFVYSSSSETRVSLIGADIFYTLSLKSCSFSKNIVQTSIVQLEPQNLTFEYSLDESAQIEQLLIDHILFEDIDFTDSLMARSPLISISFKNTLQNLYFNNIRFINSFCLSEIIKIENSKIAEEYKDDLIMPAEINGVKIDAFYTKRKAYFNNITVYQNKLAGFGVLRLRKMVNIQLLNFNITSNVSNDNTGNDVVNLFIENPEVYMERKIELIITSDYSTLMSIEESYNLEIASSVIQDNHCDESTPHLYIWDQEQFKMTNTSFMNNSGNREDTPVCLFLSGLGAFTIEDSKFYRNINNLGYGAISTYEDNFDLEIISSVLSENESPNAAGMHINARSLYMKNATLFKNINPLSDVAGMAFEVSLGPGQLKIVDCLFDENETVKGNKATLVLRNKGGSENTILIQVSSTNFTNNRASEYVSIFSTDPEVYLDSQSYFDNCIFSNNQVMSAGNIILEHMGGDLEFKNCNFTANSITSTNGHAALLFMQTLGNNQTVYITDSIISENKGHSIIQYRRDINNKCMITQRCEFSRNKGKLFHLEYSTWHDFNSVFESNNYDEGAGVFELNEFSTARLNDSRFISNSGKTGGVGVIRMASKLITNDCEFQGNSAQSFGGALFFEQDSEMKINNSRFYGNKAEQGSAILSLACSETSSVIDGSVFYDNVAEEGTISIQMGELTYRNSKMYGNRAESGSSGLSTTTGNIAIENSDFYEQDSSFGTYLYSNTRSTVTISSSTFQSGTTGGSGGAIYATFTNLTVTSCTFDNLIADSAGAILLFYNSQLSLSNSYFKDIKIDKGGVISSFESSLYVSECEFFDYQQYALFLDSTFYTEVSSSLFYSRDLSDSGGGIKCENCESLIVSNTTFTDLYADKGGAIRLYTNEQEQMHTLSVSNSSFIRNRALNGGAIYNNNVKLSVENCTFDSNSATDSTQNELIETIENGKGGGMLLICKENTNCEFSVMRSNFINNNATYNGGAIAWEDAMPTFSNNNFSSNNALYGSDISSFPIKLMQVDYTGEIIQYLEEIQDIPLAARLSSVAPGQTMPFLALAVVDHYDNIVTTDNTNTLSVAGNENVTVSGTTQLSSQKGIANFTDLILLAEPGAFTWISVTADKIDRSNNGTTDNEETYYPSVNITIDLRKCVPGEATVENRECKLCDDKRYSLSPEDKYCQNCPNTKAVCYGGMEIAPKRKFWRTDEFSSEFLLCPNPIACEGGEETKDLPLSYTGRCAKGYKGNMCQSCDNGYSRTTQNFCDKCPGEMRNVLILLATMLIVLVILIIVIKETINSAYEATALHSVYLKIFINYLQLVVLTASLDLEWPSLVLGLFSAHEQTGAVAEQIFSIDCFLDSDDDPDGVYFKKLVILSVMPVLLGLMSVGVLAIISLLKKNRSYMRNELAATVVILLFLIHPTIISYMFSSMDCKEIKTGEYWLEDNLDIRCWDSTHTFYVLGVSMPSILLWGIIVPAFCLLTLFKNKRNLNSLELKKKLGFLYNGYTTKGYYWEFVNLYKKILIICCSVFLGNYSVSIQALTVVIILLLSLTLQYKCKPYSESRLNEMEVRSILVSAVTIYCGLYFLTNDLDEGGKIFLFCVIVLVNFYFLAIWIMSMFGAGIKLLAKRSNFIGRHFLKNTRDGFPDEIFNLIEVQSHVIGTENDKFYSIVNINNASPELKREYKWKNMKELFVDVINNSLDQDIDRRLFSISEEDQSIEVQDFNIIQNNSLDNPDDSTSSRIK